MIAAFIAGLALVAASPAERPYLLAPGAACRLANQDRIEAGQFYAIEGTYIADGHHGSILEISGCDGTLSPELEGDAQALVETYHAAFSRKCGGILMGDHVVGKFTGRFVRRTVQLYGMRRPTPVNVFVITRIDAKSLDPASIRCPK